MTTNNNTTPTDRDLSAFSGTLSQSKALATFVETKTEIDDLLERLAADSAEHFGVDPDAVNWAHVGSVQEVRRRLRELVQFLAV